MLGCGKGQYPLVVEKRRKTEAGLVAVEGPFEEGNERRATLEKRESRSLLTLPKGKTEFVSFVAEEKDDEE